MATDMMTCDITIVFNSEHAVDRWPINCNSFFY